jgi:nicotinamide mononucleotide (NMN) deamidase PncC
MSFPNYEELRPMDIVNDSTSSAHYAGYELLKLLNSTLFPNEQKTELNKLQIITSESLTAGLIFSILVNIPIGGPMKYGSFSVYDTDAKRVFDGVEADDVYTHKCAAQMAIGNLQNSNATFSIAVTGNAMPDQRYAEKMRQLGEVFIGIASYVNDGGQVKIKVETSVHNLCKKSISSIPSTTPDAKDNNRSCNLFYDTVKHERDITKILQHVETKAADLTDLQMSIPDLKSIYNGFNDFEMTSLVSNLIRHKTAERAFMVAKKYVEENRDNIIIPSFIKQSKDASRSKLLAENYTGGTHFSSKSNNKILTSIYPDRDTIQIIGANTNIIDESRDSSSGMTNSFLFAGGGMSRTKYRFNIFK